MPKAVKQSIVVQSVDGWEGQWERYVAQHADASPYHELATRELIESTFGHRSHYRVAVADGRLVGLLPLFEMRSRLFGSFLVSMPFFNYGGLLADNLGAQAALIEDVQRLGEQTAVGQVELRQGRAAELDWICLQHKVAMIVDLSGGTEAYWKRLGSRLRGKVRRAERDGASHSVLHGSTAQAALPEFYAVFCRNMRDLGTPVYPMTLFQRFLTTFGDRANLFLVRFGDHPVAGAIGVRNRIGYELPWICSDYRYSSHRVNEYLYWKSLEWAANEGIARVDLGRSTAGAGPYRFKQQWKPKEQPLHWYYRTRSGKSPEEWDPDQLKYRLAIGGWRKLPLPIANRIGPLLIRSVP